MFYVTVLGSGATLPTLQRHTTSVAVQREGDIFLFDCGEGTQLQMVTTTGKHSYVMDEPEIRGGNDLGAAPFELFIAGYGG